MNTLYKLTDANGCTYNGTKWDIGVTNRARGKGTELCSNSVLHSYTDPLVAVLLNPIHAGFDNPRMFRVSGDVVVTDGLKVGSKWQRPECEIDVPQPTTEARVIFGLLCGLAVYEHPNWRLWAWNWIDGTDRTSSAATDAAAYATDIYAADAAAAYAYAATAAAYAYATDTYATDAYADAYAAAAYAAVNLPALAEMAFRLASDGV